MIHPSGIQPPKDLKLKVKEIKKGLYIVENAYEGDVEYFPERMDECEDGIDEVAKTGKADDSN